MRLFPFLVLCWGWTARADQTVFFEVAVDESAATFLRLDADVDWLGQSEKIQLTDDGRLPEDRAHDNVFLAKRTGVPTQAVHVRLIGTDKDWEEQVLFEGVVRTDDVHRVKIDWLVVSDDEGVRAHRTAGTGSGGKNALVSGMPLVVAFGWGIFVLCYVGWLVTFGTRRGRR